MPTHKNPADAETGGVTATLIYYHDCIRGPRWLVDDRNGWPLRLIADIDTVYTENGCKVVHHSNIEVMTSSTSTTIDLSRLSRFSSLTKALRTFATFAELLVRWVERCNVERNAHIMLRSIAEFESAKEISAANLRLSGKFILAEIHKNISITGLSTRFQSQKFIRDNFEIIRFESRIQNAILPYDTKNPIYIPNYSDLARLIIQLFHIKNAHAGREHALSLVRQKYWIPQPSRTVKKIIGKCVTCRKFHGLQFGAPEMPSLPPDRVEITKAFQNVGCDLMGPFESKMDEGMYICLYTCLTTRAIHLEVTKNLSTGVFLNSFLRFISRRGVPQLIRTDCGSNFKLGHQVIDIIFKKDDLSGSSVMTYSASESIKEIFSPPALPWMNGVWERLVGSVKRSFQKAVGRKKLSFEEMMTITAQIEAIISTRPIAKLILMRFLYDLSIFSTEI
ncbi:hypothetical protein RB195_022449 [Necator americanus]